MAAIVALAACGDDGGVDSPDAMPQGDAVLAMSPTTGDFGTVAVGATSSSMTFTVTNSGDSASGSISTSVTGDFDIDTDGCAGSTVAAGASCTIAVTFSPSAEGAASGSVTATGTPGGTVSATLDGTGAVGALTISPTPHPFGDVVIGDTSATQDFTVTNTGGGATGNLTAAISGGDATAFTITADDCTGNSVAAGATCTVTAAFAPNTTGGKSSSLTVTGNLGASANATITGTGLADANLVISPISPDFGSVTEGTQSGNVTLTVTNDGGVASGAIATTLDGTDASDFSIQNDNCDGNTLAPTASCTVIVRFTPAVGSTGGKTASLSATATPGGTASAVLTGDSSTSGALTIGPTPHDFGTATVGTVGNSNTFTVTNTGGSATGSISVALGGNNPTDFPIVPGGNGCANATLQPQGTCTISVNFSPTSGGGRAASLTVSAQPGDSATASLTGTGLTPATLVLTPPQSDFGAVATDKTSTRNFTLTNTGDATSGIPVLNVGGTNFGRFTIQGTPCTAALAGGASCTITVEFAPNAVQNFSALLETSASPGGSDDSILVGEGITPAAITITSGVNYGDVVEDQFSTYETFTVTNNGTEATGALGVSLTGTNPGQFGINAGTNTCAGVMLSGGGGTCTVEVRFAPTTPGTKTARLTVTGSPGGTVHGALDGIALEKLIITPDPADFGDLLVGASSVETFTVTNPSVSTAARSSIMRSIVGTDAADFSLTGGSCTNGGSLAIGASCTVDVTFDSSGTPGPRDADLRIEASGSTDVTANFDAEVLGPIQVTGPAVLPHDFGDVVVGQSDTQIFTVSNLSPSLPSGAISTSLSLAGDFAVVNDNCVGNSLDAAGGVDTCTIQVRFFPMSSGTHTGSFTVDSSIGSDTAGFEGVGLDQAILSSNPASHDFGPIATTNSDSQQFVITNTGEEVANSLTTALIGNTTRYSITANTCASNDLNPGGSCNITVQFAPPAATTPAEYDTVLDIDFSGAITGNAGTLQVAIDGESVSQLTISPTPFAFTATVEGGQSANQTFTVTNIGEGGVAGISTTLVDTNGGSLGYTLVQNNCGSLVSMADCTVIVRFNPPDGQAPTEFTAELRSTANAGASAVAELSGTALEAPILTITPESQIWGTTSAGSISEPRDFVVRNDGDVASGMLSSGIFTDGTGTTVDPDFEIVTDGCAGTTLAAQASCTVSARFTPDLDSDYVDDILLEAPEQAALIVDDGDVSATASLEGFDKDPSNSLVINPSLQDFPDTVVGQGSAPVTFTVTNTSSTNTTPPLTTWTVGNTDWTLPAAQDGCAGATLAPGATCAFDARFTPQSTGLKNGIVGAYYCDLAGCQDAAAGVAGVGLAAANLSVSPGASHDFGPVAVGSNADVTYTVTNSGAETSGTISTSFSGADAPHYNIPAASDQCDGQALIGAASCTFVVRFAPTSSGIKNITVNVASTATAGGTAGQSFSRSVSGEGVSQAILGITPSAAQTCPAEFAEWGLPPNLTSTNRCLTFTVSNAGGVATGDLVVDLPSDDYQWSDGSAGISSPTVACVDGQPLAAGANCTIWVWYTPETANETDATTLTVTASPGGSTEVVSISANALPALFLDAGSPSFGSVEVGDFVERQLTFENATNTPDTGVLTVNLDDANNQFGIAQDNCSGTIRGSGGQCSIWVRFVPTSAGGKAASLTVSDGSVNKTAVVNLSGTGTVTP